LTGKGVQAGMLVALIVGAIRTEVQHGVAPQLILQGVNDQMCERKLVPAKDPIEVLVIDSIDRPSEN
jgi:hypothetical protein